MNILKTFNLTKKQTLLFFVFIIAGIASAFSFNKIKPQNDELKNLRSKEFLYNMRLPAMKSQDFQTKIGYDNNIRHGKVLLVYLVTGCAGCQKEAEILSQSGFLKDNDVKIYGIADENSDALKSFIQTYNFKFPILLDEYGKFKKDLDIKYFPANFVLEDGIIVKGWFGNPKDKEDLHKKLNLTDTK